MNVTGKNFRANNGLRITIGPEQPSDDTPSVSPSGCQLPQRGSREGFCHSTGYSIKSGGTGDFHRPYERRFPFIGVHTENFQLSIFPYFLRFEF